jgi:hypothetical protein
VDVGVSTYDEGDAVAGIELDSPIEILDRTAVFALSLVNLSPVE